MLVRWHSPFLRFFLCLLLALSAAPFARASSGPGRDGDGDHDHDSTERDSTDTSGRDSGGHDDVDTSDGGEGGGGDNSGPSDSDSTSGDEGPSDNSGHSGGDGDNSGPSENSGPSSNSGSSSDGGEGGSSNAGQSRSGHIEREDRVSISRNDAGESVRSGEAILLTTRSDVARRLISEGFRLVESFRVETIGASALRVAVPSGMSERQAFETLQRFDPKALVTFNHVYVPSGALTLPATPALAVGSRPRVRAKVGLVDAAVNAKHPMLQQVVVNARSFDSGDEAPPGAHGTAVASLIAEAAPGATVFAANVFTVSTDGREVATADAIVRGLDWLAGMHIAVINLSLTGPANPILEAMIQRLNANGHILVAAVGNEGPRGAPQYPAAYDNVVGVTAVDRKNNVYLYANHGDYVDFAAPGVDRRVADTKGSTDTVSGTSYASPIVAAKLAQSMDVPDAARAAQAIHALEAEARDLGAPGRDPVYGYGLITD